MRINVQQAYDLLSQGEIIAVPTDTVYGLAAALTKEAVEKLFHLKKRPRSKPFVTLVHSPEVAFEFARGVPEEVRKLSTRFWPGPLTIILPIDCSKVLKEVRSGFSTAGFRVPNHALLLELLKKFGPLAVPSANIHEEVPATNAEEVEKIFGSDFPVLDGGECPEKVASTVVAYDQGKWRLYRQGSVTEIDLKEALGKGS